MINTSEEKKGFILFVLFFLVLGFLSFYTLYNSYNQEKQKVENKITSTSFLISQWIEGSFEASTYLLKSIAQDVPISEVVYPTLDTQKHKSRTEYLLEKMDIVPNAFLVGLFDKNCIATHTNSIVGFDASIREYCAKTKLVPQNKPYVSNAHISDTNQLNVTHTYRFNSSESNDFSGFAGFAINLDFFAKWLEKIETSSHGIISILDSKLMLLANKAEKNVATGEKVKNPILEKFIRSEKTNIIFTSKSLFDAKERLFSAYKVKNLPFIVVVGECNREYLKEWYIQLISTITIFLISFILGYFTLKGYKKTLKQKLELKEVSIRDNLTKLYNRNKLDEVLISELNRANRFSYSFGIIMIDIDYFKSLNDTYGHLVGDEVLKEFAEILKTHSRKTDTVGRWGGEEFLIICSETKLDGILTLAENIRIEVADYPFSFGEQKTASFGVSIYKKDEDINDMIKRVDEALYKAKENGRNRVESL